LAIKESSDELNPTVPVPEVMSATLPPHWQRLPCYRDCYRAALVLFQLRLARFGSVVGIGVWAIVRGGVLAILWRLRGRNQSKSSTS
jgi:hypothetical protein